MESFEDTVLGIQYKISLELNAARLRYYNSELFNPSTDKIKGRDEKGIKKYFDHCAESIDSLQKEAFKLETALKSDSVEYTMGDNALVDENISLTEIQISLGKISDIRRFITWNPEMSQLSLEDLDHVEALLRVVESEKLNKERGAEASSQQILETV